MTTRPNPSLSCIIPMHNEEKNAEEIIGMARSIFSQLVDDWEIIAVESGSTDSTWQKAVSAAKADGRIKIFRQEKREGMGSALRLGYSRCTKDLVCHLEADSPFDVNAFRKALPILLENDCVIGYRIGPKEKNFNWDYYHMGKPVILRTIFHVGYNLMLRAVFGLVVRDVNFSFKIFRTKDIQGLRLISNGWFIDAEILLELKRKGIMPVELPVEYKDRTAGQSTVNLLTPFGMIYEMFRYIRKRRRRA